MASGWDRHQHTLVGSAGRVEMGSMKGTTVPVGVLASRIEGKNIVSSLEKKKGGGRALTFVGSLSCVK